MATYYKIPGYKVKINGTYYKIKMGEVEPATRTAVEDWIRGLAQPTLYYETNGSNVTFTLQFTPAPADIAMAVEQHKGIQFKVIRHAATGSHHRLSGNGGTRYYNNVKFTNKNTNRGWNYGNWIQNYFPAEYKNQLSGSASSDLDCHVLTIPALYDQITNITAAELQSGTIVRTLPIFRSIWPSVDGATAGGGSNGQYEFFVGLLYWDYDHGNSTPRRFKMCYYEERLW